MVVIPKVQKGHDGIKIGRIKSSRMNSWKKIEELKLAKQKMGRTPQVQKNHDGIKRGIIINEQNLWNKSGGDTFQCKKVMAE